MIEVQLQKKWTKALLWERNDYIKGAEKELGDKSVYQKVNFKEKLLCQLVDKSNFSFKELKEWGVFRIKF